MRGTPTKHSITPITLLTVSVLTLSTFACGPTFNVWGDGHDHDPGAASSGIPGDGDGDTPSDLPDDTGDTDTPPDIPDDTGDGDGDPETWQGWAEIICLPTATPTLPVCVGRPDGSEDAWVWLVRECDLDALQDDGIFVPIDGWPAVSCAHGEDPAGFFAASRCGLLTDVSEYVCFAGDGGWLTQVTPVCELDQPNTVSAWADWQCDGNAGPIASNPWETVVCSEGEDGACTGHHGEATNVVVPTCWVDQQVEAAPPEC